MSSLLMWCGRLAGVAGFLMVLVAAGARLTGQWRVGDLSVGTLLMGGVAAMVAATLAYVASMAEQRRH
jgi:hypothetical protein